MVNKEKVVKGFQCCVILGRNCVSCPYVTRDKCRDKLNSDVFELLKGQKDIVVCKDCQHYVASRGTCSKGHAHGYAETWFCADGARMPELADDETSVKSEIIQNANGIASRIVCGKCGQELRKHTDLYCPHCGRRVMWKMYESWEESEEGITHYD